MNFTKEQIKALSWKEPYGTLMLYGKIETRTWKTNYRGLILMCASKKGYDYKTVKTISGLQTDRTITHYQTHHTITLRNSYGYHGKAFAIGNLIDCRPMKPEDEEKAFVRYYSDLFCWVFEDVKPIQPFDWKGSLGFRNLTLEEKKKIKLV